MAGNADSGNSRIFLRELFDTAITAVSAEAVMPDTLPGAAGRTAIIAIGKAAAAMMEVALDRCDGQIEGLIVTRYGHVLGRCDDPRVRIIEAGHPVPDENSLRAADEALAIATGLGPQDRLIVLLSGGGSALVAAPADGVSLAEKQEITRSLLKSGATISEINCVRKHLSRIKGGRLARAAGLAPVSTFIISDIPGDDAAFVASGPTVAETSGLADARAILESYGITPTTAISNALASQENEVPAPDALGLAGGETTIIGRATDALKAACDHARNQGWTVTNLGDRLQAESRYLGASHAGLARRLAAEGSRRVILSGGETTVTVRNDQGRGGRNLEYLLGLAIALEGVPGISALACDTDGIDGTENAAGAVIFPDTISRARASGCDPHEYLARNDAYSFFEALGDLVITGPTQTNVNDFRAILVEGGVS